MEILEILAIIVTVIGIIGCVLPVIPGPVLSFAGMMMVYFQGSAGRGDVPMSLTELIVFLGLTVLVTVLDYVLPASLTKAAGSHREAAIGAMLGMFAGIIFTPVGMITGAFLGAMIGELSVNNHDLRGALKAAVASFVGFILTTGIKLILCVVMTYFIFDHIL